MKLLVTGATGYIGSELCAAALAQGHVVLAATRRAPTRPGIGWMPYQLAQGNLTEWPAVDAVIHLAAAVQPQVDAALEYVAAQQMITYAQHVGARIVYVSSQTASIDAPTAYGRSKAAIEVLMAQHSAVIVRPGLVYGGAPKGLWGALRAVVRRLPLLPAFMPAPQVQPVHVMDVAEALLRLAAPDLPQIYRLAATAPISFTGFLREVAHVHWQCKRVFIPVPQGLVRALAPFVPACRRLLSLFALPPMQTVQDWQTLGITPRSLAEGLRVPPLQREAEAMLRYVSGSSAALLQARYVAACETLGQAQPLKLPGWSLNQPWLLGVWDNAHQQIFRARLAVATRVFEASPQGARAILGLGETYAKGWLTLALAALRAGVCYPLRLFYRPGVL